MLEIHSMKTSQTAQLFELRVMELAFWSWFSSVQAATHNEHADRTRTAHNSGWSVSFWFAVTSPLIGVLLGILALAIFQP